MKTLAAFAVVALLTIPASAEDALVKGGRSPDGAYEVRVSREDTEPSDYALRLHATGETESLFTLDDISGYLKYRGVVERCAARWHASSQFVVVTHQGTKHSRELYVLAISPEGTTLLNFPDYVQNALGRLGVTSVDRNCVSTPSRWDGDDLTVKLYLVANGFRTYTFEVVLTLHHEERMAPRLSLKSVSPPEEMGF